MTTQTMGRAAAPWGWLVGWVGANVLGWTAGLLLLISLGWGLTERLAPALGEVGAIVAGFLAGGLAGGALLGLLQGAVLRDAGVSLAGWTAATAGGLVVGFALMMAVVATLFRDQIFGLAALPFLLFIGLVLAPAQWLVLRPALPRARWWVVVGALGFTLAFACTFVLGGEGREAFAAAACGLVYAAVTGPALVWLRAQRPS